MKKLIILLLLISVTLNVSAEMRACIQHDEAIGAVVTQSNDTAVIGEMCFQKYKTTEYAVKSEEDKRHDRYSPECWSGVREDPGQGGQ